MMVRFSSNTADSCLNYDVILFTKLLLHPLAKCFLHGQTPPTKLWNPGHFHRKGECSAGHVLLVASSNPEGIVSALINQESMRVIASSNYTFLASAVTGVLPTTWVTLTRKGWFESVEPSRRAFHSYHTSVEKCPFGMGHPFLGPGTTWIFSCFNLVAYHLHYKLKTSKCFDRCKGEWNKFQLQVVSNFSRFRYRLFDAKQ